MIDIVDYGQFADRLAACAGTAERWALLAQFEREWFIDPVPSQIFSWVADADAALAAGAGDHPDLRGVGPDLHAVDPALPVPTALRDWLHLPATSFTDDPQLYWSRLIYPPRVSEYGLCLEPDDPLLNGSSDTRLMQFLGSCDAMWGYPAARAAEGDPPVLYNDLGIGEWQSGSLSEFVLHLAVMRLPWRHGWSVSFDPPKKKLDAALDAAGLPSLGLPPWHEYGPVDVYGGPDVLVYRNPGETLWAVGRNRDALERLASTIGVKWSKRIVAATDLPDRPPARQYPYL